MSETEVPGASTRELRSVLRGEAGGAGHGRARNFATSSLPNTAVALEPPAGPTESPQKVMEAAGEGSSSDIDEDAGRLCAKTWEEVEDCDAPLREAASSLASGLCLVAAPFPLASRRVPISQPTLGEAASEEAQDFDDGELLCDWPEETSGQILRPPPHP